LARVKSTATNVHHEGLMMDGQELPFSSSFSSFPKTLVIFTYVLISLSLSLSLSLSIYIYIVFNFKKINKFFYLISIFLEFTQNNESFQFFPPKHFTRWWKFVKKINNNNNNNNNNSLISRADPIS
jgi:hypothetical protein